MHIVFHKCFVRLHVHYPLNLEGNTQSSSFNIVYEDLVQATGFFEIKLESEQITFSSKKTTMLPRVDNCIWLNWFSYQNVVS